MRYPKALFIVYKYNSRMIKDIAYESTKVFKTWTGAYKYINKTPWGKSAKFIIAEQKEEDIYIYKNPKKTNNIWYRYRQKQNQPNLYNP